MSVSGIIERDELTTALRLLSRGKSTGVLVASTSYSKAAIGFRDGDILYVTSSTSPKLGEMILERKLVSAEKLEAALWVQRQDKEWRALGRVLIDVRVLTEAQVAAAVEAQITRGLDNLFRWDQGTFRFEQREPATGELILPSCRDLGQYEVRVAILRVGAEAAAAAQ